MILVVTICIVILTAMLLQECRVEESKSKEKGVAMPNRRVATSKSQPRRKIQISSEDIDLAYKEYVRKEKNRIMIDALLQRALDERDLCSLLEEYSHKVTDQYYKLLRVAYGLDSSEGLNVDRLYTIQWVCMKLGFVVFKGDDVYYNPEFITKVINTYNYDYSGYSYSNIATI